MRTPFALLRRRVLARYHPSAFLLLVQVTSFVLYAFVDGTTNGRILLSAFSVLVLPLSVWVVSRSPAATWVAWALLAPALVVSLLSALFEDASLLSWSALLEALLYFYTAGSLIAYMMEDHRVTTDELFAAGATFTLIAWGFAYLFLVCQTLWPGSFVGAVNPEQPRTFLELLFLSFTNLSGTGIGDVLPILSPARVLVIFEQFAGVGYLAMVVSRLVGMTIVHQRRSGREQSTGEVDDGPKEGRRQFEKSADEA